VIANFNSFGNFSGTISISANISSGLSALFNPASIRLLPGSTNSSHLTISTSYPATQCGSSASPKLYAITVNATDGSRSHKETFSLTVYAKGDVNLDGSVDISDLVIVGAANGTAPGDPKYNPAADLNKDGLIDVSDIVLVAANNGYGCP